MYIILEDQRTLYGTEQDRIQDFHVGARIEEIDASLIMRAGAELTFSHEYYDFIKRIENSIKGNDHEYDHSESKTPAFERLIFLLTFKIFRDLRVFSSFLVH